MKKKQAKQPAEAAKKPANLTGKLVKARAAAKGQATSWGKSKVTLHGLTAKEYDKAEATEAACNGAIRFAKDKAAALCQKASYLKLVTRESGSFTVFGKVEG